MRICYLTNSAIPSTSANSIATVKMCEAFTELKNEVILITRNVKNNNKDIFKFYDVKFKFKFKKIKNFNKFPLGIKYYLFSIISIISSLNFKPDLYITRNFFTCFLLVLLRKKVIIEIHHDLNNESRIVKILIRFTKFLNSKYVIRIITIGGIAVPSFWLGMLLIMLVLSFGKLPPLGTVSLFVDPLTNFNQMIWPAISVGYRYTSVVSRMLRSSILEVLSEDYIRTARAKGLYEKIVIVKHGMRNALLPTITVIGLEFAFLLGGLVVTESVFNLNGIGKLFVDSVVRNDLNLLQGLVLTVATSFVVINLIIDLFYAALDPRIRYQSWTKYH